MAQLVGEGFAPPPEVRERVEFHWFHVPAGGSLLLAMLSPTPLWYVGHYHGGRMRVCSGDGCSLCAVGVGRQIRYVVCAVELSSRILGVLEIGPGPGRLLADHAAGNGGLRGVICELYRAGRSKHARLEVGFVNEHPPSWVMASEPLDLRSVLESTWARAMGKGGC